MVSLTTKQCLGSAFSIPLLFLSSPSCSLSLWMWVHSLKEACKFPHRLSLPSGVLQMTSWGKGGDRGERAVGVRILWIFLKQYFNTDHHQNAALPNLLLSQERGCENMICEIKLKFRFEGYLGSFWWKVKTSQHIGRPHILSPSSKQIN